MLIRSQDKTLLIPLSQGFLFVNGFKIQFNSVTNDGDFYNVIGEYSSRIKCIKVLDMIQDSYVNSLSRLSESQKNNGFLIDMKNSSNVFQMPHDDEI